MNNSKLALEDLLIRRFSVDREQVSTVISEVEAMVLNSNIEEAKKKSLEKMELHLPASIFIENEVSKYREKLYKFSREAAQNESELDIVTKAHAIRAKEMVWSKKSKWDFSDALLSIGGLFLGTGIPHLIDLIQKEQTRPSIILILLSIFGSLTLGMGIVFKSKN